MSEATKCEVVAGPPYKLNPCQWLEALRTSKYHGLGIDMVQLVNFTTMKPSRQAWVIRSGKHAKKGMTLNFCPMCGESLRGLFEHLFEPAAETSP